MKISVVIPTYNRPNDLERCLDSILIQETRPQEVLVIDNGRGPEISQARIVQFQEKNIILKYIRNQEENSLTLAKNRGVDESSGDLISFLDDDVVLDKEYYREICRFFEKKPKALGLMAQTIVPEKGNKIRLFLVQLLERLFFLGFEEKERCRLLASMGVTAPLTERIINCQWISGASTYKREIFNQGFRFDEKLKKYSWGEDTDFSHRVFKKYPDSLFFNPRAKYIHKLSEKGRTPKREIAYMEEVYYLYLFFKIIDQKTINKLIYLWSRLGRIIFKVLSCLTGRLSPWAVIYSLGAYFYCLRHLKEIKQGNLDFFNNTLS